MQIVAMMNLTSSPSSGLSWKARLGPSPAGGGPGFLQRVATGQKDPLTILGGKPESGHSSWATVERYAPFEQSRPLGKS